MIRVSDSTDEVNLDVMFHCIDLGIIDTGLFLEFIARCLGNNFDWAEK
jgi:uncharacterized protein (DUF2164 family)